MGRIAPRKRVSPEWDYQALVRTVQRLFQHLPVRRADTSLRVPSLVASASLPRIRGALRHLWHHPDTYRWMEPLPPFHRRWILITTVLLLLVLLWPYTPPPSRSPQATTTPIALQTAAPMQANMVDNPPTPVPAPASTQPVWQEYRIMAGQTLAQLFRDNNLPVNDVFAMAQVEGRDKPLSNLRAGQEVKLQLNTQGMVAELEIETTDGQIVHFSRQADGAFLRTR